MNNKAREDVVLSLLPFLYGVLFLFLTIFTPIYLSIPVILIGLWFKRTSYSTLVVLFLIDTIFYAPREIFYGKQGVLFISGVVLFVIFNFLKKKLFSHAIF